MTLYKYLWQIFCFRTMWRRTKVEEFTIEVTHMWKEQIQQEWTSVLSSLNGLRGCKLNVNRQTFGSSINHYSQNSKQMKLLVQTHVHSQAPKELYMRISNGMSMIARVKRNKMYFKMVCYTFLSFIMSAYVKLIWFDIICMHTLGSSFFLTNPQTNVALWSKFLFTGLNMNTR